MSPSPCNSFDLIVTAVAIARIDAGVCRTWSSTVPVAQSRPMRQRPESLRGRFGQLDVVSLAAAFAADSIIWPAGREPGDTHVIVATKDGNKSIRGQYIELAESGRYSPLRFAASGFSACSGVIATVAGATGPSLSLVGSKADTAHLLELIVARATCGSGASVIAVRCEPGQEPESAVAVLCVIRRRVDESRTSKEPVRDPVIPAPTDILRGYDDPAKLIDFAAGHYVGDAP